MTCGPAALATSPRCVSVEVCDTVRGPPSRYPGEFQLAAGNYAFTTTTDDGVRLYIDGSLALDHWTLQGPTTYTVTRALSEGTHQIVLEYFENAGGGTRHFFNPSNLGISVTLLLFPWVGLMMPSL